MKKLLPFFSLALFAVACNSKPENADVKTLQTAQQNTAMDTAGLAQFQQWKAQNELNAATPIQQPQAQPEPAAPVKTVEVIREVRVVERPAPARKKTVQQKEQSAPVTSPTETQTGSGSGNGESTANTGSGEANQPVPAEKAEEKKGWSKSAKGAVIGGGAGAVLGAVINKKNRAAGAVIGGVLGGAVGYGIGKAKDKKDTSKNQ